MEQIKTIEAEIVDVDNRLISIESEDVSGDFEAAEHILMQYVRPGKARIKIDSNGKIVYAHNIKQEGEGFKKTYPNSSGFKKTFAPANSFNKQNYTPQPTRKNRTKAFTHVTLLEFQQIYNEMAEKNTIKASNIFKTEFTFEDENKIRQYYYDAVIFYEE
jgi:hypothetical protein